jgi:hypothetical protein
VECFGCKQAVQAFVKIQAGQELITTICKHGGIHIIQGKPTLGAGIASAVKSGKYDYKVKEMSEKIY